MGQFGSSLFDAVVGVGLVLGIPAAAINHTPATIGFAVLMVVLVAGRIVIERGKARRARA